MIEPITSWPLTLAIHTAAMLLWFRARGLWPIDSEPPRAHLPLVIAASLAAIAAATGWVLMLGLGPGLVTALWATSLIGTALIVTAKVAPDWMPTWVLACVLAGGMHVVFI
ncbi:hypothetical protein SCOR_00870 [Sulfidibacter corallicola]|uniref:Uncharacterized protein n=1 Tax=Sulfidibacter corallicola TaxID=2818388 RepID=A0A8A4TID7_SULCO|nr:hypothetical protein [Sulfidibacter corallicola]QTD48922.1 hypothetical protein J3U87_25340 [Sulfidibacter corallicola]